VCDMIDSRKERKDMRRTISTRTILSCVAVRGKS